MHLVAALFGLVVLLLILAFLNSITVTYLACAFPYRLRIVAFRLILYTASLIHEGFHLLACMLTFTRVIEFRLCRLTEEGYSPGYVLSQKRGFIRTFIISLAPQFGSLILLALPFFLIKGSLRSVFMFDQSGNGLMFSAQTLRLIFNDYPVWVFFLIGLMTLFISPAILPSASDLKEAFASLIIMLVLFLILNSLFHPNVSEGIKAIQPGIAVASTYVLVLLILSAAVLTVQLLCLILIHIFSKL